MVPTSLRRKEEEATSRNRNSFLTTRQNRVSLKANIHFKQAKIGSYVITWFCHIVLRHPVSFSAFSSLLLFRHMRQEARIVRLRESFFGRLPSSPQNHQPPFSFPFLAYKKEATCPLYAQASSTYSSIATQDSGKYPMKERREGGRWVYCYCCFADVATTTIHYTTSYVDFAVW